jgi:hypothetical protein
MDTADAHEFPDGEEQEHVLSSNCWCRPQIIDYGVDPPRIVHQKERTPGEQLVDFFEHGLDDAS